MSKAARQAVRREEENEEEDTTSRAQTDQETDENSTAAFRSPGRSGERLHRLSKASQHSAGGTVPYDQGPDQEGLASKYGMDFVKDGQATRVQRLEAEFGEERVQRWAEEGMTVDTMAKPRDMRAFRERQAERPDAVPTDVERQNQASLQRNREASGETGPAGEVEAPDAVRDVISSPGQSMDETVQREMESKMGGDFSDVQMHTGPDAAAAADSINARAFTVGNHVAFNRGEYDPGSDEGQKVLAHELTHVRQQTGGRVSMLPKADADNPGMGFPVGSDVHVQPKLEVSSPDDPAEREAERVANSVVYGDERVSSGVTQASSSESVETIQRIAPPMPENRPGNRQSDDDGGSSEEEMVDFKNLYKRAFRPENWDDRGGWELPTPPDRDELVEAGRDQAIEWGEDQAEEAGKRALANAISNSGNQTLENWKPVFDMDAEDGTLKAGYKWPIWNPDDYTLFNRDFQIGTTPFFVGVSISAGFESGAHMHAEGQMNPQNSWLEPYPMDIGVEGELGMSAEASLKAAARGGVGAANVAGVGFKVEGSGNGEMTAEFSHGATIQLDDNGAFEEMELDLGDLDLGFSLTIELEAGPFLSLLGKEWDYMFDIADWEPWSGDANILDLQMGTIKYAPSEGLELQSMAGGGKVNIGVDEGGINLPGFDNVDGMMDKLGSWLDDEDDEIAREMIRELQADGKLATASPERKAQLFSMVELGDYEYQGREMLAAVLESSLPGHVRRRDIDDACDAGYGYEGPKYLLVEAYTQERGSPPRTGQAMYQYLMDKGIDTGYVEQFGFPEGHPSEVIHRALGEDHEMWLPDGFRNPLEPTDTDNPIYDKYIDVYQRRTVDANAVERLETLEGFGDIEHLNWEQKADHLADLQGGDIWGGGHQESQPWIVWIIESISGPRIRKYVLVDAYAREFGSPPENGRNLYFWLRRQVNNDGIWNDHVVELVGDTPDLFLPFGFRNPDVPPISEHPVYDKWIHYYRWHNVGM